MTVLGLYWNVGRANRIKVVIISRLEYHVEPCSQLADYQQHFSVRKPKVQVTYKNYPLPTKSGFLWQTQKEDGPH